MNSLIEDEFPLHETQSLRYEFLNALTDHDLDYKLPGDNPTLGELCREMGEFEQSYIDSFKTFRMDWSYRNAEPGLATSVERLKAWYRTLDDAFETVMRGFSEETLHSQTIDRGQGFAASVFVQFQIFREAVLIFLAKAIVYLKALQKPINDRWRAWIG